MGIGGEFLPYSSNCLASGAQNGEIAFFLPYSVIFQKIRPIQTSTKITGEIHKRVGNGMLSTKPVIRLH